MPAGLIALLYKVVNKVNFNFNFTPSLALSSEEGRYGRGAGEERGYPARPQEHWEYPFGLPFATLPACKGRHHSYAAGSPSYVAERLAR